MSKTINQKLYIIINIFFIVLNLLNTYLLTTALFNRYIVPFNRTFFGELNAILGNLAFLFLIIFITNLFVKDHRKRMVLLLIVTFLCNFLLYALTIYTKYYGISFSLDSLNLFKNPSSELGFSIVAEAANELISYYRIILFIPFLVLLILIMFYRKPIIKSNLQPFKMRKTIISLIAILLLFISNLSIFNSMRKDWPLNAARSTFASQNIGIYSYYFYELLGVSFDIDVSEVINSEDPKELYDEINKNQVSYQNIIDQKTYGNKLAVSVVADSNNDFYLSPEYHNPMYLNGLFAGKNLVLMHLETFNYFLLENPEISNHLPFLKMLLSESYVFDNFYANVGVGNSSDAEFSVLTGLYPLGNSTIYWDFTDVYQETFKPHSLVDYFNKENYHTEAIHGDTKAFYNRGNVYPKMYGFDYFYNLDDFKEDGYNNEEYRHPNPWISDYGLMDLLASKQKTNSENYFFFPMPMMPHTPFLYDPYETGSSAIKYSDNLENNLSSLALKYLRYLKYYDEILARMFIDPITGDYRGDSNTVYIFYGDHGSGLDINDLSIIMNKKLSVIEHRQLLSKTISFIYAPTDAYNSAKKINQGGLIGTQSLVRGQVDLYRTIIELFDLPVHSDPYFGVNMFSNEPTYSIDAKMMDCILDNNAFSMLNPKIALYSDLVDFKLYKAIIYRKELNDALIVNKYFSVK